MAEVQGRTKMTSPRTATPVAAPAPPAPPATARTRAQTTATSASAPAAARPNSSHVAGTRGALMPHSVRSDTYDAFEVFGTTLPK